MANGRADCSADTGRAAPADTHRICTFSDISYRFTPDLKQKGSEAELGLLRALLRLRQNITTSTLITQVNII